MKIMIFCRNSSLNEMLIMYKMNEKNRNYSFSCEIDVEAQCVCDNIC